MRLEKRNAGQEEEEPQINGLSGHTEGNNLACKEGSEQVEKEDVFAALPTELRYLLSRE